MQVELILLLFLVILAILYAGNCGDTSGKRITTIVICLVVIILFCYMRVKRSGSIWEGYVNYAPTSYNLGTCGGIKYSGNSDIMPVYKNYDGLVLKSDPRPNVPLVSDVTIFSPVGDGIKLTEDPVSYTFNTVNDKPDSPRHLFMLANNQVSWDCCPSTYSTDRGCVCVTKDQVDMINKRKGNRTTDIYPNI
jgi:hypothetical protein